MIYKNEIKKAIINKSMLFAIVTGIVLCVSHSIYVHDYISKAFLNVNEGDKYYRFDPALKVSFLQSWLGGEPFSAHNNIFYLFCFPLFAAFPYSYSAFRDKQLGYNKQLITAVGRKSYANAKFLAAFLSGGISVTIPAVLSLMYALAWLPIIPISVFSGQTGVVSISMWADIFFDKPLLYALMYIALDFVIGGMWACVSLSLTHVTRSVFTQLTIPMIANIAAVELLNFAREPLNRLIYYVPYVYTNPVCILDVTFMQVVTGVIIILALIYIVWMLMSEQRNYLE